MKEYFVRALSGAVYISIVILSLFASYEWFMGLILLLAIFTLKEFLKVIRLSSFVSYIFLVAGLFFLSYTVFNENALLLLLILTLFVNLFLVKDLLWTHKIPMFEKKKYIVVIFYLISGFIFLTRIPFANANASLTLLVSIFCLIWANDTFAYLIGKNLGKRKLLPKISPKKTVEGFVGGIIGALLAGFIIFKVTDSFTVWIWLSLGVIASVFGTIGDLIQSKFKRQAGVKDSGTIMPGHGGLYDRLDSIIYTSPFIYGFLELVDYVS